MDGLKEFLEAYRYFIYTVLLIIIYGFDASNPQGFIYFQF